MSSWRENIREAFPTWQFWVADVVGAGAFSTAMGLIHGPWIGFSALILGIGAILGLVALSDFLSARLDPKRLALSGGALFVALAAAVMVGYSAIEIPPDGQSPQVLLGGARPDVRIEQDDVYAWFGPGILEVQVHNYGDRIVELGYVTVQVSHEEATRFLAPFSDLAPGESQRLQVMLIDVRKAQRLEDLSSESRRVTVAVDGCYIFEGRSFFTNTVYVNLRLESETVDVTPVVIGNPAFVRHPASCPDLKPGDVISTSSASRSPSPVFRLHPPPIGQDQR